jgi:aminomethyltransferase
MGEVKVTGPGAMEFVNYLVTNDIAALALNQIMYSPMCYPDGGVVDDLLIYRLGEQEFLLVVNAANTDKDFAWITEHAANFDVIVDNISDDMAELALQGPKAEQILQQLTSTDLAGIKYYWLEQDVDIKGIHCLVSRTGYTGEDGFEIYCQPSQANELWSLLLETGKDAGLVPTGLGARDTLRFEACLPLYGHELSDKITPLEAGVGSFVKLTKNDFIGKVALAEQKAVGVKRKIVGLEVVGRGIARPGYRCLAQDQEIGIVTSGSYAPTLNKNLALGLIALDYTQIGQEIAIEIRGKGVATVVVKKPFYKREKGGN